MNIKVEERKLTIDGKEYTFRLDFKALIKFEERYESAIDMFNQFLQQKNIYGTAVKILSCSCVERDFTEEELADILGFNLPTMNLIDEVTLYLMVGSVEKNEEGTQPKTETEKNE